MMQAKSSAKSRPFKRAVFIFLGAFILIFAIDQILKFAFLFHCHFLPNTQGAGGCRIWESPVISLVLVFNDGVAFSMFSFLGGGLKYVQLLILIVVCLWLFLQREFFASYALEAGFVIAAGASNLLDRFLHGGVVDYVYWHYYFEFAVFNFADVMIDVGVGLMMIKMLLSKKQVEKQTRVS